MSKIQDVINKVRTFCQDVGAEMKKSTWPGRRELVESTIVVIVSIVLISVFIGISDKVLAVLLRLLIPVG